MEQVEPDEARRDEPVPRPDGRLRPLQGQAEKDVNEEDDDEDNGDADQGRRQARE
jgi:hypothetical protein